MVGLRPDLSRDEYSTLTIMILLKLGRRFWNFGLLENLAQAMAPKQQPLSSLGVVARKGNGWRADMKISSSSRCRAPVRDSQKAAEEDLHLMRAAASRDDVPRVVKDLHDAGGGVAAPSSMSDRPQEQNMPNACGNTILAIKAETSFKEETSSKRVRATFPSERKHHLCPAGHCLVSVPGYEHEEGCQVSLCDIGWLLRASVFPDQPVHETDEDGVPWVVFRHGKQAWVCELCGYTQCHDCRVGLMFISFIQHYLDRRELRALRCVSAWRWHEGYMALA